MPESTGFSQGRVREVYEFIRTHRQQYSIQAMCQTLEVAPSGYYAWLQQPVSNRVQEDARLLRLIRASFTASQGVYGAPRVFLVRHCPVPTRGRLCFRTARLLMNYSG